MALPLAPLALDGGDPREKSIVNGRRMSVEAIHNLNDRSVLFEEYMHYAAITRDTEHADAVAHKQPWTFKGMIKNRFNRADGNREQVVDTTPSQQIGVAGDEKTALDVKQANGAAPDTGAVKPDNQDNAMVVTDAEWYRASRAIRTAGWSAIFYLITTDILGPFSVPWAFAQMGYGPGVALYTVFAGMACLSGYYLWRIFCTLDSDRYPLKDFGMAFFRVFGPWSRHGVNVLQAVQMILTVSALILSNGQAIAQVSSVTSDNPVCFVVCLVIFTIIGMILGQIRTLQRFGWLANFAVWINVLILIFTMAVAAHSGPYMDAVMTSFGTNLDYTQPIQTFAGTPPDGFASGGTGFTGSMNGLNQAIYSYGGAMLFFNFMSEMRHPWDFWKSLIVSNLFIYVCYMFFGIFVYSFWGQYTYNPAPQGIGSTGWRVATNIMNIVTGLIAAVLYGNIGIKVIYTNVLMELLHFPALTKRAGKFLWVAIVPVYWALAFVVAAAIPQFSYVTGLIGAVCILSFTYTFPALLAVGFYVQKDAVMPGEYFDEATKRFIRTDGGWRRWARGYMVKWHVNTFNVIYFLGALATCGLGVYSSVEGLIGAFQDSGAVTTSFGCVNPAG